MRKILLASFFVALAATTLQAADTLDVYFLDVGHGDSILIDYGDRECLIDFGGPSRYCPELHEAHAACGATCLDCHSGLLLRLIAGNLELAVLSHNHWDHYGGFAELIATLSLAERQLDALWLGPDRRADREGTNWEGFKRAASTYGFNEQFEDTSAGPPQLHPDLTWIYLAPQQLSELKENDNTNSSVLLLTYGSVGFLFTGDLESLPAQAGSDWDLPEFLIFKQPHHGSDVRGLSDFLKWADPELAIISADADDLHDNTRETLGLYGVPFLQTSDNGTICVSTDGTAFWVRTREFPGQDNDCPDD